MSDHEFDVAFTFAGEDRPLVNEVVQLVKAAGFSVFYDEDAKIEMWGEDLTEYFANVYEQRARFAVMFVSVHYAAKAWTNWERRSVLSRALNSNSPYLLPVRVDSTDLPGMRTTIGYLDATKEGAAGIAEAVKAKLGAPTSDGQSRFNGRVPRTATELAVLLGERPTGWEFLLFSYWLSAGLEKRTEAYNDFRVGFALNGAYVPTMELPGYLQAGFARMSGMIEAVNTLLLGPAQMRAFGEPGVSGDPDLIEHLAGRLLTIYDGLLKWAEELRSAATTSDAGRKALRALADYAAQPIEAVREFVADFRDKMDALTARLQAGEEVGMQLFITWELSDEVTDRYHAAFDELELELGS